MQAAAQAPRQLSRNATLAMTVVGLHVAGVYALQSGLLRRAVEVVVPVQVLAQFVEPAQPKVEPPPPPSPPPKSRLTPQPVPHKPQPTPLPPPPMPLAVVSAEPSPNAVTGVTTPQPPAPPVAAPVSVVPVVPPAPPAPPRIELPSSHADYLNNPAPRYPPVSKRLGEQGKVVVRVFIGVDGTASQAEVRTSSGFDRLDQTALNTVLGWKYVPGKVNGEPKAMWFNVPINFVLE
ncbi:MAG TPA: energy transducer TonB [Burkholderiaceae bacterium]|nr:energy transducer TonB [Burkholderiaceae bacterium]